MARADDGAGGKGKGGGGDTKKLQSSIGDVSKVADQLDRQVDSLMKLSAQMQKNPDDAGDKMDELTKALTTMRKLMDDLEKSQKSMAQQIKA